MDVSQSQHNGEPNFFVDATTVNTWRFSNPELYNFWYKLTLIIVMMISSLFSVPLSYLVLVQTRNVLKNTTTYARYSKAAKMQAQLIQQSSEGQDQGTEDWPHSAVFIESLIMEQTEETNQFTEYNSLDNTDQFQNEGGKPEEFVPVVRPLDPIEGLIRF